MQETRQERTVPLLLYLLTAVAGLIDAVSYIGLHVFTPNMTGNDVLLGSAFAGVPGLSVVRSLTALGALLAGAVIGGRLAADSSFAEGSNPRWQRRVVSILLMFAGAFPGARLLRYALALPLAGATVLTVCGMARFYGIARLESSETPVPGEVRKF